MSLKIRVNICDEPQILGINLQRMTSSCEFSEFCSATDVLFQQIPRHQDPDPGERCFTYDLIDRHHKRHAACGPAKPLSAPTYPTCCRDQIKRRRLISTQLTPAWGIALGARLRLRSDMTKPEVIAFGAKFRLLPDCGGTHSIRVGVGIRQVAFGPGMTVSDAALRRKAK